jgi:hypothetical protein
MHYLIYELQVFVLSIIIIMAEAYNVTNVEYSLPTMV